MKRVTVRSCFPGACAERHGGERRRAFHHARIDDIDRTVRHCLVMLLPIFQKATGIAAGHVVAVGTGQALAIGMRGDADVLLVHDRAGEDKFVAEGTRHRSRADVMFNDFVLVGPRDDPARMRWPQGRQGGVPAHGDRQRAVREPRATTAAPTGWSCASGRSPAST